jgi:hypothetical protein
LAEEYPSAHIFRDRNGLQGWVSAILRHLRGQEPICNFHSTCRPLPSSGAFGRS